MGVQSRREWLRVGALGAFGLSLRSLLAADAVAEAAEAPAGLSGFGRAKRCLLVYLSGGPSQLDTWDMKPDAPTAVRGELTPIATRVPGVYASELLPLTARQADKFTIVRSVTHLDTEHSTSFCTMLTGTYHPRPGVVQPSASPTDHPHLGAIAGRYHGWSRGMPPFVSLPTLFQPPGNGVWPGQTGGFLGERFGPLVVEGDKHSARFRLPALELPDGMSAGRLEGRRDLLGRVDRVFAAAGRDRRLADLDALSAQAYSLLEAPAARRAFDLGEEPDALRDRYGRHVFGQGLLLARRLCEAGVRLVSVYWIDPTPAGLGGGEFDSHGRIYHHMRQRLFPPTDRALSALFEDLHARGLLSDTLVVVMAEFGRSPRINKDAGRDHWPRAQSILLAGAGIAGGRVFGATDRLGADPSADPVSPPDLGQTVLHLLGVPEDLDLPDQQGRPIRACRGRVVSGLIG
jgi:hypothetical protein